MSWRNTAYLRQTKPVTAELKVVNAYQSLFGKSSEDAEIVLADLAAHTGFYLVHEPGADLSNYQAGHAAGMRTAFARIFQFLSLPDDQLRALEEAARQESEHI